MADEAGIRIGATVSFRAINGTIIRGKLVKKYLPDIHGRIMCSIQTDHERCPYPAYETNLTEEA